MVVQGDVVVNRYIDFLEVILVAEWLLSSVYANIGFLVLKVVCLELAIEVLLEELLRQVGRKAELEH